MSKAGCEYTYWDTHLKGLEGFDPLEPELLIVLGGAPGVYQADLYPFLKDEINIIEKRLAARRPVLGVCLGAQLMAKALGSDVYVGEQGSEKGWFPIKVNDKGQNSVVNVLDKEHTNMLHWRFQCHLEVNRDILYCWMVNAASQVAEGKIDLKKLKKETDENVKTLQNQTEVFFENWISELRNKQCVK
jgi:GMP synthase (glutamine-hydrolysing)